MKNVIEALLNRLGLAADAAEAVVLEKLNALPTAAAVTELQNSLRDLQGKHDALATALKGAEGELVNRHLADFEGVISEGAKAFWSEQLLKNRDGALAALGDLAHLKDEGGNLKPESEGQTRRPLHNRATARPVIPGQGGTGGLAESKAVKIRNRAHEIAKAEGVPFASAFRRAEKEVCEG